MKSTSKITLTLMLGVMSFSAFALDSTSINPALVNVTPVSPSGGSGGGRELVKDLKAIYDGATTETINGIYYTVHYPYLLGSYHGLPLHYVWAPWPYRYGRIMINLYVNPVGGASGIYISNKGVDDYFMGDYDFGPSTIHYRWIK